MDTPHRKTADLPLAVWPCAQKTSQWQRHGRYLPDSNRHPAKMLPALARRAIETYSDPGDLVVDPMCGIGTTLVEAADLGRRAIGVELEPRWAGLAVANLDHVHGSGRARSRAKVIEGDARQLPRLLSTRGGRLLNGGGSVARIASGAVDLILTSPPYACEIADVSTENLISGHGPLRRVDTSNYSADRRNLGHARGGAYLTAMAGVYGACAAVLKPGGYLVLVTKDMRSAGALRNLSGETITLCEETGLLYWQRIIALLATVRDAEIVMRPSFWQTLQVRKARARGNRTHVVAHEDVLVFRKPIAAAPCAPARRPRR
jgi:modification methylase